MTSFAENAILYKIIQVQTGTDWYRLVPTGTCGYRRGLTIWHRQKVPTAGQEALPPAEKAPGRAGALLQQREAGWAVPKTVQGTQERANQWMWRSEMKYG